MAARSTPLPQSGLALADLPDFGASLAPGARVCTRYGAGAIPSRGRRYSEPECTTRSPFQRDRDRVLHATAFRRLTYKTQVFVHHEGDHYRTRLTHSLEVAQIARTMARQLGLDEDLAEVLSLAHDLGHPPFGHAGEEALDRAVAAFGGFGHNIQSFRLVTKLERKYLSFDGLNLTWETLEGLIKHNGPPAQSKRAQDLRVVQALKGYEAAQPLNLDRWPSGEAQVASLADDIAWHTHDIDDGLRAGLITLKELEPVPIVGPRIAAVTDLGTPDQGRVIYEVTRQIITALIADAVAETRKRLSVLNPSSPDDIRGNLTATVAFSPVMGRDLGQLRTFLFSRFYRHPHVNRVREGAEMIVRDLVGRYLTDMTALPEAWQSQALGLLERKRVRLVADFVAGQTDRYAIAEHRRLFDVSPVLR